MSTNEYEGKIAGAASRQRAALFSASRNLKTRVDSQDVLTEASNGNEGWKESSLSSFASVKNVFSPVLNSFLCFGFLLSTLCSSAFAQTNPPPGSYIRSYVNDLPDQPLVSVSVTGAVSVACFTIEETLPAPATPLDISGDGVWLPAQNAIRWGPYFNTVATNVSYRLTGLPASYPVNGGAWMDGHWYFSPGVTMVSVLPATGPGATPSPPPQVATPHLTVTPPGTVPVFNPSFETPVLGPASSVYYQAMTVAEQVQFGWLGSGNPTNGPALFANNSGWGYATVSNGVQAVSLPASAAVSQIINFPATGNYTLNWLGSSLPGQTNPAIVQLDGSAVCNWQATNPAWGAFSTPVTIASAGNHALSFAGLGGANVSMGLDDVSLTGSNVPASITIFCATPGATIYYTLDGSLPSASSLVYTGAIYLTGAGVVRAAALTNGWAPSVASVAYYGLPAAPANALVIRTLNTNDPAAPVVTFNVIPGTNAYCVAFTESLPLGLGATNVTAAGNYIASNNVVLWGPFLGTNVQTLSYEAAGPPGVYPVRATWSVDGVGGGELGWTNVVIASSTANLIPTPPPQVATPGFTPTGGGGVPVSVTVTDATAGAVIYYTVDGSLPTPSSTLYSIPIYLASAGVVRAAAFTNGWLPSVASVAYFGPPALPANVQVTRSVDVGSPSSPMVTFGLVPGATATCLAVTESLPAGLGAINVSSGGNYIASNNVVLWGPFMGTNAQTLSYQAVGLPGIYPVRAAWSVDGVGGGEAMTTNISITAGGADSTIPTPPTQVPSPVLTPALSASLPVAVSITCSDSQAQIYYTTDGTLPTQNSTAYTTPLEFGVKTSLRAVAFEPGSLPSTAMVGEYVPVLTTNTVSLTQGISENGSFLPTVSLTATPQGAVGCYAVVESIPYGLTPSSVSGNGYWDPNASVIRWGPYLDNQPRSFSFNAGDASGIYPLTGQVSFNGYSVGATNAVEINANYIGSAPVTNLAACATDFLTYNININPAPGVVTVTSVNGTVDWGDGTQSAITQPVMTLEKSYSSAGTYAVVINAPWTGYSGAMAETNTASNTDFVQVVTTCLAPQIVTQPSNQVVFAGSPAQFSVSASSPVPMTFQWYYNTNSPVYSASDFATLTLPAASSQLAGLYLVVIANAFGSVTSSPAALMVVRPQITGVGTGPQGVVTLDFEGLPNATTRIWATTNLAVPAGWLPIFTNTMTSTNGCWQFIDTNATGYPIRFYRFSTP